ncbi:MAG: HPr family phosphocarrier protein [Victivallaceae bacterium]|nr:HPr family phosphocarrier protein [Victivallaceae bacterium]
MRERIVTIHNKAGIHCRPSSAILTVIMNEFPNEQFEVVTANGSTELTSILNLISLGLQCGETATLRVEGPNEDEAIGKIGDLFEYEFDFPQ